MKRIVPIGAGAAAAIIAAALLLSMAVEKPTAAVAAQFAAEAGPRSERLRYEPEGDVVPVAEREPSPLPARARLETLARRNGGVDASTPTEEVLSTFTAQELDFFARMARVTGRSDTSEARELVARRRSGASAAALTAEADRIFAADPIARAAAREWIRQVGAPRPDPERKMPASGRRLRQLAPAPR